MTKASVVCAQTRQSTGHGKYATASSGTTHEQATPRLFEPNSRRHTVNNAPKTTTPPKATASSYTIGGNASTTDANITTSVFGATKEPTPPRHAVPAVSPPTTPVVSPPTTTVGQVRPSKIGSPVNAAELGIILEGYNREISQFLFNGFTEGFRIPHEGPLPPISFKSLSSAKQNPNAVRECLRDELLFNRIAGPFKTQPINNLVLSPIGVVPKKTPGKFRLIHHLSYPTHQSINDGIDSQHTKVQYHSVDMAIEGILRQGQGSYLAKTDIKSAFRLLPVHKDNHHLLGFYFEGDYYYDKMMPMGLSISCQVFEKFSSALQWAGQTKHKIQEMLHILDDFLIIAPTKVIAANNLTSFQSMCKRLGVPLAPEKTEGPSRCLSFAGIELDTETMEARLPPEKITKYLNLVNEHAHKKKATLRDMQSLVGSLNHCCYVIPSGRAFLRRLIDLTKGVTNPHHHIRYNKEVRADLATWSLFLANFNGRAMLLQPQVPRNGTLEIYTDASQTFGFGAILNHHWFAGTWPGPWASFHITLLELYPIVAALYTWKDLVANKHVLIYTDNMATKHIINSCSSKDPNIMHLIRPMVRLAMSENIRFESIHIPGKTNNMADSLSRFRFQEFRQLSPNADLQPTVIPTHALPLSFIQA